MTIQPASPAPSSYEFCDGRTFSLGARIRFDGLPGTVVRFSESGGVVLIHAEIDQPEQLRGYERRVILNPEAAAAAGRPDFYAVRDAGKSAGNFELI